MLQVEVRRSAGRMEGMFIQLQDVWVSQETKRGFARGEASQSQLMMAATRRRNLCLRKEPLPK